MANPPQFLGAPRFLTPNPIVEFLPDGVNVILHSDIAFQDSKGRIWTAKAGKRSDGTSDPSPLWPILGSPFTGFQRDGALLHDDAGYLFAPASESSYWRAFRSRERAAADLMIWEATVVRINEARDMGKLAGLALLNAHAKADSIFYGLRAFGFMAWADHARENAKEQAGA